MAPDLAPDGFAPIGDVPPSAHVRKTLWSLRRQRCLHDRGGTVDNSGNRKLGKKRSTGRIDGMVALVMALGVALLRAAPRFDVAALIS